MRIITGSVKGKRLLTPKGENTRPTSDRVKEGIFSVIQFDIEGRTVLDLFAGSGQMGIEALSRGAECAVFVDNSRDSIEIIKKNLQNTELGTKSRILQSDYISFLSGKGEQFDIAFLDPPYENGLLFKALTALPQRMKQTGMVICEHPSTETLPDKIESFIKQKTYRYGNTSVTIYRVGA